MNDIILKEKRRFEKNDVWLYQFGDTLREVTINKIQGEYIFYRSGMMGDWVTANIFNKNAKQRLGKAIRIFGYTIGVNRNL